MFAHSSECSCKYKALLVTAWDFSTHSIGEQNIFNWKMAGADLIALINFKNGERNNIIPLCLPCQTINMLLLLLLLDGCLFVANPHQLQLRVYIINLSSQWYFPFFRMSFGVFTFVSRACVMLEFQFFFFVFQFFFYHVFAKICALTNIWYCLNLADTCTRTATLEYSCE